MNKDTILRIDGEVNCPLRLSYEDLSKVAPRWQVPEVSRIDAKREGVAVTLEGILQQAEVRPRGKYVTLHASKDDFHASVGLEELIHRGILIYQLNNLPLPQSKGGPVRFYIRDFAACKSAEVDECANVKFVDHIEITSAVGFDNRPRDEQEHSQLHEGQLHEGQGGDS